MVEEAVVEEKNALRLAVYHFRRLNNDTISAQHTLQKIQLHLDTLDKKLKIQQSTKRTIKREIKGLSKRTSQLHARLKASLPKGVLPQLERCQALRAENTVREYKMLHELHLMDRISEVFEPLSLLLVPSPEGEEAERAESIAALTDTLKENSMGHRGPEEGLLVRYASNPQAASLLMRWLPNAERLHIFCTVLAVSIAAILECRNTNRDRNKQCPSSSIATRPLPQSISLQTHSGPHRQKPIMADKRPGIANRLPNKPEQTRTPEAALDRVEQQTYATVMEHRQ